MAGRPLPSPPLPLPDVAVIALGTLNRANRANRAAVATHFISSRWLVTQKSRRGVT